MPKKSFLERMGLVERSSKTDDRSDLKDVLHDIGKDSQKDSGTGSESTRSMDRALESLELKNKLLDDFNANETASFGFAGLDILNDKKSVSVEDILPKTVKYETISEEQVFHAEIEKEFASAAEAMKVDQKDTSLFLGLEDPGKREGSTAETASQNDTGIAAAGNPEEKKGVPVVEDAKFTETESVRGEYHTQIAEDSESGLKVEENVKESSAYKPDPYIGDKLDLIIGAYEKNRLLTIEEIYRNSRMETDTKKTIFMTDVFLQAIPTNLPLDVKRETVLNILKISGIELETLLSDAYKRIDSLNKVMEETISTSNDIYERNENTIRELERRIQDLRDINTARQDFQVDQNTMIEYEMQKIINLVEFVKPKAR